MIVCLCKGVSSSEIREVIGFGASSLEEIGSACGAGTDCGSCTFELEDMLKEAQADCSGVRMLPVIQNEQVAMRASSGST